MITNRRDMRVARTIFIIFMMVLICSVPVAVIHAIESSEKQPSLFLGVHILYWLQYCLNVAVYVLMNRQYREAYVELLARLFPIWERYKGFTFPWENPSTSSKHGHGFSSSLKGRKDSCSQELSVVPKEYKHRKPPHSIPSNRSVPGFGRLSAIVEINSSSCVSSDVFASEHQGAETGGKTNTEGESSKVKTEPSSSLAKEHKEEGTQDEKQLCLEKIN